MKFRRENNNEEMGVEEQRPVPTQGQDETVMERASARLHKNF